MTSSEIEKKSRGKIKDQFAVWTSGFHIFHLHYKEFTYETQFDIGSNDELVITENYFDFTSFLESADAIITADVDTEDKSCVNLSNRIEQSI